MTVGTPWKERIEQELSAAHVLILLLSARSVQSEMVQQELALALKSRAQRQGLPLIFTVRLAYNAPFPYPLNFYLDSLQWAVWESPEDTPHLLVQLQSAIAGEPLPLDTVAAKQQLLQQYQPQALTPPDAVARPPVDQVPEALEQPEGTMEPGSEFYIERAEDRKVLAAVGGQSCTFSILGPRQMGKSSLLMRAIAEVRKPQEQADARPQEKQVAFLDFQRMDAAALQDADLFYRRFCEMLTQRLRKESRVEEWWQQFASHGNPDRCSYYVQDYLLDELGLSVFLAMDEVDKLIASPFRDEFFGMLRSWHNERAYEPIWKQLDLALVTCTEPYQLIQDLNQSPFNVGTAIALRDFQPEEVGELNRRHGNALSEFELQVLMEKVGGHPYLTRKALYLVASKEMSVTEVFETAASDRGQFCGH